MRQYAKIFLVFAALTVGQSVASAQSVGVSYYAMPGFSNSQCTTALKVFDDVPSPALTTLWATFGTNQNCLARYLDAVQDRQHILEIHISNQVCLRHTNCGPYEISGGLRLTATAFSARLASGDPVLIGRFKRRISEIVQWAQAHKKPTTRLLITTGLEDDYSNAAYRVVLKLLTAAKSITPFEIVRNPIGQLISRDELNTADFLESHDVTRSAPAGLAQRCIINNDGTNISFSGSEVSSGSLKQMDVILLRSAASDCMRFLWWGTVQGFSGSGNVYAIDPRRRVLQVRPHEIAAIRSLILAN